MTASPTVLPNFATHVVSGGTLRSGDDGFGVILARWLTQILDIVVATIGKKLHTIPKMLKTCYLDYNITFPLYHEILLGVNCDIQTRLSKKSKFAFLCILSIVKSGSYKSQNEGFRVFRQSQVYC